MRAPLEFSQRGLRGKGFYVQAQYSGGFRRTCAICVNSPGPGLFVTFEETPEEVQQEAIYPGGTVAGLIKKEKLAFDYVHVGRGEREEAGDYGLDGLLIRLNSAIDSVGPG